VFFPFGGAVYTFFVGFKSGPLRMLREGRFFLPGGFLCPLKARSTPSESSPIFNRVFVVALLTPFSTFDPCSLFALGISSFLRVGLV